MSISANSAPNALAYGRRMFSAAHFYTQTLMNEETQQLEFGRCHTTHGHGHNYFLELGISGHISSLDPMLFAACDRLDHQHLNFDIPAFRDLRADGSNLVPTTENIALYLKDQVIEWIHNSKQEIHLHSLRVFETDDLWVEVLL
jgi:6-pyruvoyltetrahydropterin/6-carboxytetrahydropterin synthase